MNHANFLNLHIKVAHWARQKDILYRENVNTQFGVFMEEMSELHQAKTMADLILEAGDVFVTLIILWAQTGRDPGTLCSVILYGYQAVNEKLINLGVRQKNGGMMFVLYCWIMGSSLAGFTRKDKLGDDFEQRLVQVATMHFLFCLDTGINPEEALSKAYYKIKNRKGKKINGSFIKESDLDNQ